MLECLSGQDEGALSLSAKGNFNISKLNDVSGKGLVSFPQYPLLLVNHHQWNGINHDNKRPATTNLSQFVSKSKSVLID